MAYNSAGMTTPIRSISSRAPIRICDLGGWTDTWFAVYGQVLNLAVTPGVQVRVTVDPGGPPGIRLHAANYGDDYRLPDRPALEARRWARHPLLEAAVLLAAPPPELSLRIAIHSEAPPGAGTGTSAAVTVALLGALDRLDGGAQDGQLSPHALAYAAQRVETELLGGQCGIQDQLCAAYGGVNFINMYAYPQAEVQPLDLPPETLRALEAGLALVYLGQAHNSSKVHEMVIRELEDAGPDHPTLEKLRRAAAEGRDALLAGDLPALGAAMQANTAAQEALHPEMLNPAARRVIALAGQFEAWGWKVNGAGGPGGSLTVLLPDGGPERRRAFQAAVTQALPGARGLPIALDPYGLQVWEE